MSVLNKYGLIIWSTAKTIRVTHFERGKQKLTKINAPPRKEGLPDHLYHSNLARPYIVLKESEEFNGTQYSNVFMFVAWINTVRKIKLELDTKKDKFIAKNIFETDLGAVYLTGMNIQMCPEYFVFCQFDYPVTSKIVPSLTLQQLLPDPSVRTAEGTTVAKNTVIHRETLAMFEDYYQDLNYSMAVDLVQPTLMLMFNPESIVKVSLMMIEQQLEYLLSKRCYDEAAFLLESNRSAIGPRYQYLILKTQNGQMYSCLKNRNLEKLRALIINYLGKDKD